MRDRVKTVLSHALFVLTLLRMSAERSGGQGWIDRVLLTSQHAALAVRARLTLANYTERLCPNVPSHKAHSSICRRASWHVGVASNSHWLNSAVGEGPLAQHFTSSRCGCTSIPLAASSAHVGGASDSVCILLSPERARSAPHPPTNPHIPSPDKHLPLSQYALPAPALRLLLAAPQAVSAGQAARFFRFWVWRSFHW